jgi:large repetitive protein
LLGTDLGSTYSVSFGGVTTAPIGTTATSVTVVVPEGAITSKLTVYTNMYGLGYSDGILTILKPVVTSLSPTSGKIYDEVTITGSRLNIGTYKVYFSGVSNPVEAEISAANSGGTSLTVSVPVGAVTGPISVTTDEGTATSSTFTVLTPSIVIQESLTTFTTNAGTPSESQNYIVSGYNLGGGLTITAPQNFEVSMNGAAGTWGKSIFYPLGTDGSIEQQPVYVRYVPTITGTNSGNIVHSSDGVVKTLTVNGEALAPLPVELISFKAQKQADAVLLTWATASEKDNSHFEVEMTADAKGDFKAVGKVNSKATNSSVKTNYQFNHNGSFTGTRYYRLKQVDLDGTTSYSNVIAVEMTAMLQETVKVAPNPISSESKLLFPAAEAGKLNITVVNMSGSKVAAKSADVEAGVNTIELGLSETLPSGMYILTTEFNGKTEKVKLIKQ